MAKMCEVCGKAPVFGNKISHAHNVSQPALAAEPAARRV